jgi:hypothetical protein
MHKSDFVEHELKAVLKYIRVQTCILPLLAQIVTDVTRKTSEALREIVSKVRCNLYIYKSIKEKLMSL